MKKKIIFLTASLLMQGCSSPGSLNIHYNSYGVIKNRYHSISYDDRDYGLFFIHNKKDIRPRILAVPLLACKIDLSHNGQQQTQYLYANITPAIDNRYTYIAEIDFSLLNPQKEDRYKGYIFENDTFYVVKSPTCRITFSDKGYDDYNTPIITVPKQDVTKKRLL